MTRIVRGLIVTTGLLALLGLGSPALASVIVEAEADGTAVNNTLGTAQAIPSSAFTTPVPATVFNPPGFPTATIFGAGGGVDVDFYSFTATGGSLLLDIDDPTTFDTILSLFSSDGTLLAENDDSLPPDLGSSSDLHSFVGTFTLPGPGTYFVAVSEFDNFPNGLDSCSGSATLTRPDGEFGGISFTDCSPDSTFPDQGVQQGFGYTLHISLSPVAAVPGPATLALLVSAGAGLVAVRAWRRR